MKMQEGDQGAVAIVVPAEQETGGGETSVKVSRGKKAGGGEGGGLRKGPWTPAEDQVLVEHVQKHGEGNWNKVQRLSGLKRCGKSCRLRWANHLRPNLKKGAFSSSEEELILRLHAQLGNKWARMAAQLPGRTDNEIKNFWNTRLKRRQRVGLPIYPPKFQETIKSDGGSQQLQHLAAASSGVPPLPSTRRWPELNPLQLPTQFIPANPCPSSRITLPPIPWSPFPCHLDFGFSLTSISPPTTPTPLLQKHQIGTQSYGMSPLAPPPAPVKMELSSFQMFPDSGGGGVGAGGGSSSGSSSCMLMEALLQDTHVSDDVYIGELLAPPEVDQQIIGWGELVCGSNLVGGNVNGSKLPATKIGGMDCSTGIVIGGDAMSDAGITEYINIPALLDVPAPANPTITDWYNTVDGRLNTTNVQQSSAMANGDLGFELQQLASSLSHDLPAEQEWNVDASTPWDMSGIC